MLTKRIFISALDPRFKSLSFISDANRLMTFSKLVIEAVEASKQVLILYYAIYNTIFAILIK